MTKERMYEMYHEFKPETKEKAFFIVSYGYIEAAKDDIASTDDRNQQALYAKIALDSIAILHNAIFGEQDLPRSYDYDIKYLMMYADETQKIY